MTDCGWLIGADGLISLVMSSLFQQLVMNVYETKVSTVVDSDRPCNNAKSELLIFLQT